MVVVVAGRRYPVRPPEEQRAEPLPGAFNPTPSPSPSHPHNQAVSVVLIHTVPNNQHHRLASISGPNRFGDPRNWENKEKITTGHSEPPSGCTTGLAEPEFHAWSVSWVVNEALA